MKQRSVKPIRKVAFGGTAGMVATVLIFAAQRTWHFAIPPDVALAAGGIVVAVVSFFVSWLTPPAPEDAPVPAARRRRDPFGH